VVISGNRQRILPFAIAAAAYSLCQNDEGAIKSPLVVQVTLSSAVVGMGSRLVGNEGVSDGAASGSGFASQKPLNPGLHGRIIWVCRAYLKSGKQDRGVAGNRGQIVGQRDHNRVAL